MNRKISKSKISHKRYQKAAFERVEIDRETYAEKKRVFKPKSDEPVEKKKSSVNKKYGAVGYCSIKNFPDIIKRMSNSREEFANCINQFIEAATDIVQDEGGLPEKFSDGGIMFYFPVDKNFSDGSTRAVIASLKIRYRMNKLNRSWEFFRRDAWNVRTGISTGDVLIEVIEGEDKVRVELKGETAKIAKGIGSIADAGKVLITDNTYNDRGFKKGYFQIEEPYHMHLKETETMTKVHQVIAMVRE